MCKAQRQIEELERALADLGDSKRTLELNYLQLRETLKMACLAILRRGHGLKLRSRPDLNGNMRTFEHDSCDWADTCSQETCVWLKTRAEIAK